MTNNNEQSGGERDNRNNRSNRENGSDERESTYSGEFGERNRSTPGRTPGELGLDPEEMRGHDVIGNTPDRAGDLSFRPDPTGNRENPPETHGVETIGEGGTSKSGGRAGGSETP